MSGNSILIVGAPRCGKKYIAGQLSGGTNSMFIRTKYYTATPTVTTMSLADFISNKDETLANCNAIVFVYDENNDVAISTMKRSFLDGGIIPCAIRLCVRNFSDSVVSLRKPAKKDVLDWCADNNLEHLDVLHGSTFVPNPPDFVYKPRSLLNDNVALDGFDRIFEAFACSMWPEMTLSSSSAGATTAKGLSTMEGIGKLQQKKSDIPNRLVIVDGDPKLTNELVLQALSIHPPVFQLHTKYFTADLNVQVIPFSSIERLEDFVCEVTDPSTTYGFIFTTTSANRRLMTSWVQQLFPFIKDLPVLTAFVSFNSDGEPFSEEFTSLGYAWGMEFLEVSEDMNQEDSEEFGILRLREVFECAEWRGRNLDVSRVKNNNAVFIVSGVPKKIVVRMLAEVFRTTDGILEEKTSYENELVLTTKYYTATINVYLVNNPAELSTHIQKNAQSVVIVTNCLDQAVADRILSGFPQADSSVVCTLQEETSEDENGSVLEVLSFRTQSYGSSIARLREIFECTAWSETQSTVPSHRSEQKECNNNNDDDNDTTAEPTAPIATCSLPPGWLVDPVTKISRIKEEGETADQLLSNMDSSWMTLAADMKRLREAGSGLPDAERRERAAELALKMMELAGDEE